MASCDVHVSGERNYRIVKLLSEGVYGKIYEVKVDKDFISGEYSFKEGMTLAMKVNKNGIGSVVEIDILNRVRHPNVVNSYDTFLESDDGQCSNISLILPLAKYNLHTYIKEQLFNANEIIDIMYQLLCGLSYLHSNFIIHDDIKPDNILVYEDDSTDKMVVKITDFGISGVVMKSEGVKKLTHAPLWQPPEIMGKYIEDSDDDIVLHSYESDIWAMGTIFYELITKTHPFGIAGNTVEMVFQAINDFVRNTGWRNNPVFQGQLTGSIDIITRMLDPDPKTRASAEDLLKHSIFNGKTCLYQQIKHPECDMFSYITDDQRRAMFDWMKGVKLGYRLDYGELFLAFDIFDRYFAALTRLGPEHHIEINNHMLAAAVSMYLATELQGPGITTEISDYLFMADRGKYSKVEFTNMICNILKNLNWVVFRPTLYMKHPELDPEKLFRCYLATPSPTLEMCDK